MPVEISQNLSLITILILAGKWYHDHMTIADMKRASVKKEERISILETEKTRVTEALERTYVSTEFLFKNCYSTEAIDAKERSINKDIHRLEERVNSPIKCVE